MANESQLLFSKCRLFECMVYCSQLAQSKEPLRAQSCHFFPSAWGFQPRPGGIYFFSLLLPTAEQWDLENSMCTLSPNKTTITVAHSSPVVLRLEENLKGTVVDRQGIKIHLRE